MVYAAAAGQIQPFDIDALTVDILFKKQRW
jgi:hypothetical protein